METPTLLKIVTYKLIFIKKKIVIDRITNKIVKFGIQQAVKDTPFPMWDILLRTAEDCLALILILQKKENKRHTKSQQRLLQPSLPISPSKTTIPPHPKKESMLKSFRWQGCHGEL